MQKKQLENKVKDLQEKLDSKTQDSNYQSELLEELNSLKN